MRRKEMESFTSDRKDGNHQYGLPGVTAAVILTVTYQSHDSSVGVSHDLQLSILLATCGRMAC